MFQQTEKPVGGKTQQQQSDWDQGLPEPAQQALGMAGVDACDRGRVVAQQPSRFNEIAKFLFDHGRHCQ